MIGGAPRQRTDVMIDTLASRASSLRPKTVFPGRRDFLLLVLLGAVLMMPVTYRAGTDQAHVHTIFQGMIDAIVGHPHHHSGEHEHTAAPSPFSPPGIPLSSIDGHHTAPITGAESDVPQQVQFAGPALAFTALLVLGALVAALVTRDGIRLLWRSLHPLAAIDLALEPPPPRPRPPLTLA